MMMIPIRSSSLVFLLVLVSTSSYICPPSAAAEGILINCGAEGNKTAGDNRTWTGDRGSGFMSSSAPTTEAVPNRTYFIGPALVPYMTARIFTTAFTYSIPVPANRTFLRLYFYSSDYPSRDASDAVFDVTSGPFTLLKNFSTSDTILKLQQQYGKYVIITGTIFREFSLDAPPEGFLNITFAPSSDHPNAYAFVNGIEIVPMPNLFTRTKSPTLVTTNKEFPLDPGAAFQTMYRLNVGGEDIKPTDDSGGLYRRWADDSDYISGPSRGITTSATEQNVTIRYPPSVPDYIAPVTVYETARSTTWNLDNLQSNLNWSLTVDPGYHYLVRLHFCEIQKEITKENQKAFSIYISNLTAATGFDIIAETGGNGIPTYRDFVTVSPVGPEQVNLWVGLLAYIAYNQFGSQYDTDLLNGLEVFKVNGSHGSLAGPRPTLLPQDDSGKNQKRSGGKTGLTGGLAGGLAALFLVGILACFLCCRRRRYNTSNTALSGRTTATTEGSGSSLPTNLCRHFSFREIESATNGFDDALLLGVGGFGKVYRGSIDRGTTEVAIKRANPTSQQGVHEFQNEIEMLSKLRHRHLVSLIGYSEKKHEMILVYDYMARGTLREHLYKTNNPPLSWRQRLEICIGAARGLHYLHTGAKNTIIHRDVKSTNILLDENWTAKVSDFGLCKATSQIDHTHVSTAVKGSFGYLDPEYYRRQQLTSKSDVYSFGVVLFEVLCARPALHLQLPEEQVNLAEWALSCLMNGLLDQIIDPFLQEGEASPESLKIFVETAQQCLADHGINRPDMGDVLWNLGLALQLQDSANKGKAHVDSNNENDSESSSSSKVGETINNSADCTVMSTEGQATIFTQIKEIQGR